MTDTHVSMPTSYTSQRAPSDLVDRHPVFRLIPSSRDFDAMTERHLGKDLDAIHQDLQRLNGAAGQVAATTKDFVPEVRATKAAEAVRPLVEPLLRRAQAMREEHATFAQKVDGYFAQVLDGRFPDASNLLLPTLGLIDPRDARFISTVEAYERLLVEDGLMLRYRHKDDFGDTTSAFSICSFWWAEALAMVGRLEDACRLFERLMTHANCVGLFSEDIEPRTGMLLGNFPQAYTHVGLINTAVTISELLEARDARFRAWS